MLNQKDKEKLRKLAKNAISCYLKNIEEPEFIDENKTLSARQGAFVTLKKAGTLRGCIGMIESNGKKLYEIVHDMAIEAAVRDPRFSPISLEELEDIEIEISVLSVPKKIHNWQDIELGKHGVIISQGVRSGVFLPQVADEANWTLEEFLSHLCRDKAGLPEDAYKHNDVNIRVFTAQVI